MNKSIWDEIENNIKKELQENGRLEDFENLSPKDQRKVIWHYTEFENPFNLVDTLDWVINPTYMEKQLAHYFSTKNLSIKE